MSDRHADQQAGASTAGASPAEAAGAPAAAAPARPLPVRPDTPCVAVCSTTFDDICRGCGRTVVEVAHWVSMTAEQKEVVWERILAQGYPRRKG